MPVIIQQGNKTFVAMPGLAIGMSEEEDEKAMKAQKKYYEQKGDDVTLSLLDKAKEKLRDYADELIQYWDAKP